MNLLLVEDNKSIVDGLIFPLEQENYIVNYAMTIDEARKIITEKVLDLIILDFTLPDGTGFELYDKTIKALNIPTIFLTAKDDEETIVEGLTMGAEDYITKPFSTKELLARINKILLRAKKQNVIKIKDIKFDIDKMICYKNDEEVVLTSLEIKLLHMLIINLNKTVLRNAILDKVWELTGNYIDDHTITTYFNRIRKKLGTDIIITVKGIGYRIENEK